MRIILDIEANSLTKPTKIWLIVCKDIDTGEYHVFRNVNLDATERENFTAFSKRCVRIIGHNILGYDVPVLSDLLDCKFTCEIIDTLVVSKLVNYSREEGHSLSSYGEEFGLEKIEFNDWTKLTPEMEVYCVRDVDITELTYAHYKPILDDPSWHDALRLEHDFQIIVNDLHTNGFAFNQGKAEKLLAKVKEDLHALDGDIERSFPTRPHPLREVHPRLTRHGTLNKSDFRFRKDGDLSEYNGGPFTLLVWKPFNAASHKQVIDVLHSAGWSPTEKTKTHIELDRHVIRVKRGITDIEGLSLEGLHARIVQLKKYGWKVNENNLSTLPPSAPAPARTLAKRILLESRRRTLTEWLGLYNPETGRIHGTFQGIGAWTHRMAHQAPNMANIPNDKKEDGTTKVLGKELRSLWQAPRNRLLVGVDAEGIQLRIFAHYIDDKEFTEALVKGSKHDKTDPHSLNQRVLGRVCKSRQVAKRFIYALLLGAGIQKLSQILECNETQTREALDRLLQRYTGFARLKTTVIPRDARHGYFIGLDGRKVSIPGDTDGERKHLAMSGYLQNGEAIVMKKATLLFYPKLKEYNSCLVDLVHDEWQSETPNNLEKALLVAKSKADALTSAGEYYKLKCPLSGSYWSDAHNDYSIGVNWYQTH